MSGQLGSRRRLSSSPTARPRAAPSRGERASALRRPCAELSTAGWESARRNTDSDSRRPYGGVGKGEQMQIAFMLSPGFTALDAIGPFDVLGSVPGHEPVFVAEKTGPVRNDSDTMSIVAARSLPHAPSPDVRGVPGGVGPR